LAKRSTLEEESLARSFLNDLDVAASDMCYRSYIAEWRYASDINDENERLKVSFIFYTFYFFKIF